MADNITLNPGSGGATVATEDVGGGVQASRVKLITGALHTDGGDVTVANPFPVQGSDGTNTWTMSTASGALDEAASKWLHTASGLYALDPAAAANSQQVPLEVEATASPNLRVAVFKGANQLPAGDAVARGIFTQPGDGTSAFHAGSAANLAAESANNSQLVTRPGDWSVTHSPAANTQATATKAAGAAGTRHVCTGISAVITAGATAPTAATVTLNLRDGASGTGTVLQSWTLGIEATAGRTTVLSVSGLHIVGSDATAMTLEFAAAGGANTLESVNLTGHDAS